MSVKAARDRAGRHCGTLAARYHHTSLATFSSEIAIRRPHASYALWTLLAVVVLTAAVAGLHRYKLLKQELAAPVILPSVAALPPYPLLFDTRPVRVRRTVNWRKVESLVPRYRLLSDAHLWTDMQFEDWDRLPTELRTEALDHLFFRYGYLAGSRRAWARMSARDWDRVPQPVRAMAFLTMLEDWTRFYDIGQPFGLSVADVMPSVKAIAMTESWFDHRARFVNSDGSVDMGLGGSSAYARGVIRRWYQEGRVDFTLEDGEYDNPVNSARFLVFWFGVMLHEADGNLELAIRGYNWGVPRARAGNGEEYLAMVQRRLKRYLAGDTGSPTWKRLNEERTELLRIGSVTARQRAAVVAREAARRANPGAVSPP